MMPADTQTVVPPATLETEKRGGCWVQRMVRPTFDREYHERLAVRLDNCFRAAKPPTDEDLAAAVAAVMALASSGQAGSEDVDRLNWLESECRAGRVQLSINHVPRGVGNCVRDAIDDARRPNEKVSDHADSGRGA